MARLFVTSINLNKNELQNARIQNLSSAPSSPVTGQIYYDSTESKMYYYNGLSAPDGPWMPMSGSTEVIQDVIGNTIIDGTGLDKLYDDGAGTFTLSIDSSVTTNSGSQTLTNKSIDLANNTLTGTVSQFNTALSGDNFATLTGSETLTNKTLTSPSVSGLYLSDQSITFEGVTPNDNETILTVVDPTADRTITLPDATGTVALLQVNKVHEFAAPTADFSMNGNKITNVATPTQATDAANKSYVDGAIAGIDWKESVHLLAATNVALTGSTGTLVIDSHDALGDADDGYRILLKGQTTDSENGIYVYADNGTSYTLSRPTDADTAAELIGIAVFVMEGTVYGTTSWVQSNHYLTDFTGQSWVQFSGAGAYTAGAGLTQTGTTFNVGAGVGITVNANDVAIDTSVTARKYAVAIGDNSATSYTVTHNLNNQDVLVQIVTSTGYVQVEADVSRPTNNTVTVAFATAPTTNEYRVIVIG
jgi:hypothetical protein